MLNSSWSDGKSSNNGFVKNLGVKVKKLAVCNVIAHYSWFDWHWSGNGQNMNFGFWKKFLAQIIADYVYFHMVYHTFIWNHCGCYRRVLNMTHFQLFWFGKFLLVKKIFKNLNFCLCTPLHPKPILNHQVGFGPGLNEKISGSSRSTVSTGQKRSRKTDFQ